MNAAKPPPFQIEGMEMTHTYLNRTKRALVEMGESGVLTGQERVMVARNRQDRLPPENAAKNISYCRSKGITP